MASAAFWKGVRCWQFAKCLRVQPQPGALQPKVGLDKVRARIDARSPNFVYQILVPCWMRAVDGDNGVASLSGQGRQVTRQIYMGKTLEFFVDNAQALGQLAWVEDTSDVLAVAAGASGGTDVDVTYTAATYDPSAGDLVLFRNPNTGEGFVTTITLVGAKPPYTMRVNLQRPTVARNTSTGEPVMEDVDITTDWEILKVSYYYDKVAFSSMSDPEVPTMVEDKTVLNCAYTFMAEAGIVYPASLSPDFTTS